jgi:hypothetical protein
LVKALAQTLQELGKTISRNVIISGVGEYAVNDVDSYYFVKWTEEPRNIFDADLVMSPISNATKTTQVASFRS